MITWRIEYARHADETLSGEGARRYGGRWNEKGTAVVYCSSHLSLAALEKFVHAVPDGRDVKLYAVSVEIADALVAAARHPEVLPEGWRDAAPGVGTMRWGTRWARSCDSLVAVVPSTLLPLRCFEHRQEFNLLLNVHHDDMQRVGVLDRTVFSFDPRMWKS